MHKSLVFGDDRVVGYIDYGYIVCKACVIGECASPVYRSNVHPYSQDCQRCHVELYRGSLQTVLFDSEWQCPSDDSGQLSLPF